MTMIIRDKVKGELTKMQGLSAPGRHLARAKTQRFKASECTIQHRDNTEVISSHVVLVAALVVVVVVLVVVVAVVGSMAVVGSCGSTKKI